MTVAQPHRMYWVTELRILKWWILRECERPISSFPANNVVGAPVLHLYFSLEFCVFCVCPWTNYFSALSVFELHIDWVRVCVCFLSLHTASLISTHCWRKNSAWLCAQPAATLGRSAPEQARQPRLEPRVKVSPGQLIVAFCLFSKMETA